MKKVLNIISLICIALTLVGALVVIISGGEASPGFAIIPMVISIACNNAVKVMNKKK